MTLCPAPQSPATWPEPAPATSTSTGAGPQLVLCPTCHDEVPGLLAGCWKPKCLTAGIDQDHRHTRLDDN